MVEPATPATPAICHQNGRLEITAYQGASVKVLAYADESEVIAATDITAAYQEIDLAGLAAGQYIVVLPDVDAVIVNTAQTGNMAKELELAWEYLLPALGKRR
jgi:hypothetical protein